MDSGGGSGIALTHLNDQMLAQDALRRRSTNSGWIREMAHASIRSSPSRLDSIQRKSIPVLFFIHGGPEGAWGETWSYRWNPHIFASQGYLVVMPNPRGSTGYGQRFIDDINGDWGGKAYDDIMAV